MRRWSSSFLQNERLQRYCVFLILRLMAIYDYHVIFASLSCMSVFQRFWSRSYISAVKSLIEQQARTRTSLQSVILRRVSIAFEEATHVAFHGCMTDVYIPFAYFFEEAADVDSQQNDTGSFHILAALAFKCRIVLSLSLCFHLFMNYE